MTTSILTQGRVTWTHMICPDERDIQQLSTRYPQFHALNLQDCLTELEFPKLDHFDDYLFLVVQFPLWDAFEQAPRPAEIDIFVARGTLVTSHQGQVEVLDKLFARAQADPQARVEMMDQGASPLLYCVLSALVDGCFPLIHKMDHDLRYLESSLFKDKARHVLNQIAGVRHALISMRHILGPQIDVVRSLERGNWPFIHEDLDIYWGDISDHLTQLHSRLEEDAEVVAGLSETVDTLASHRIDEVVRLLTVVTVITLPLTLLAAIFGMNIVMPYAEHPLLFYMILGIGLIFTLVIIWYLNRQKWL
jgi:magnesium transporter